MFPNFEAFVLQFLQIHDAALTISFSKPMGVYDGSTFHQGQPSTPAAHPAPSSSLCTTLSTIGNGFLVSGTSFSQTSTSSVSSATITNSVGVVVSDNNEFSLLTIEQASVSATTGHSASATAASSAARLSASKPGWKDITFFMGSIVVGCVVGAGLVL